MQLFLSWQQKFRLLLIFTVTGLALMALSALWANANLGSALRAQQEASSFGQLGTSLLNSWLKLESQRRALNSASVEDYEKGIAQLSPASSELLQRSQSLEHPQLAELAQGIDQTVQASVETQTRWLALQRQLGLSASEGQRQALTVAAQPLEAINIALIRPNIETVLKGQRDYLATFDETAAQSARQAMDALKAQLVELDWQDSKIGESTTALAAAFTNVDDTIGQIKGVEDQLRQQNADLESELGQLQQILRQQVMANAYAKASKAESTAHWVLGGTFILIATALFISISRVSRVLIGQLRRVIEQLGRVANGNLTASLEVGDNARDEFNQLGEGANRMTQGIAQLIRQVIDGNRELNDLHGNLLDAMRSLDTTSSHVESQTEQAASASHQISVTVNEMAQRASEVGDATQRANDAARTGARVVGDGVESMRNLSQLIKDTHGRVAQLSQSSSKVAGIIDVINSLADQTNLLALNAAIEAARAGDAGRGFSVVADEVRSLAQKTVAATTDISQIISELRRQTDSMDELMNSGLSLSSQGERHAAGAAEAIADINASMDQLSAEMHQVVVAIEEISTTTEDISMKMEDINVHTRKTRDLRQTLDAQSQALSVQVSNLEQSAGRFEVA